jgi:hypothetical protein
MGRNLFRPRVSNKPPWATIKNPIFVIPFVIPFVTAIHFFTVFEYKIQQQKSTL